MFQIIKIVLLAAVQGLTALLPVSSLGHFSLLKEVLGYNEKNFNASFYYALFSIAVGLALYIYYFSVHSKIIKNIFRKKDSITSEADYAFKTAGRNMLLSLLPLLILYIPLSKKTFVGSFGAYFLSGDSLIFVGIASVLCAILMFISLWYLKTEYTEKVNLVSPKNAFFFGVYQLTAYIFPGISHVSLGSSRIAVSDIDIKNLLKETYLYIAPAFIITGISRVIYYYNSGKGLNIPAAVIGFIVCFALSLISLFFINKYFNKKSFKAFAIYTLVFGLVVAGTSLVRILL